MPVTYEGQPNGAEALRRRSAGGRPGDSRPVTGCLPQSVGTWYGAQLQAAVSKIHRLQKNTASLVPQPGDVRQSRRGISHANNGADQLQALLA